MDESFKKKIIDEINKSGFPLEIDLVNQLREQEILTFSNISFQDSITGVHEIDIFSIIFHETTEWDYGPSGIQLLIECKKTEKYPWLFFSEGFNPLTALGRLSKS
ncbi:MAG: hypothetical protein WKG07_31485 [Hymenobacter sp.]